MTHHRMKNNKHEYMTDLPQQASFNINYPNIRIFMKIKLGIIGSLSKFKNRVATCVIFDS